MIVPPDRQHGLPLGPEAMTHQDGETHNDGEAKARPRRLKPLREACPTWPLRVVEDRFSANGPHLKLLKELNLGDILSVKPAGQDALGLAVKPRVVKGPWEAFAG